MARLDATWPVPQFSPYSILNVICQAIHWVEPINNPLIKEFRVQLFDVGKNNYTDLGTTQENYVTIPTDDYELKSAYQLRVATIGTDGRQSSYAVSSTFIASPLRFDFSSTRTAKLPDGRSLASQRLLFLLF